MQFTKVALLAAAATAVSAGSNGTIVYTTDIVTAYTTYCPAATSITLGSSTYTVTEATTLTITDCPCTVVKPVTSSAIPTSAPIFANSTTTAAAASTPAGTAVGTVAVSTSAGASASPSPISASNGNKAATLSGAALAGLLGLAAYVL